MAVLLPEPEVPITARYSPWFTFRQRSSRAVTAVSPLP